MVDFGQGLINNDSLFITPVLGGYLHRYIKVYRYITLRWAGPYNVNRILSISISRY